MWLLPISILVVTTLLAIPLSKYLAGLEPFWPDQSNE